MLGGRPSKAATVLSAVTAIVAVAAAAWTLADPGLLHGPPAMNGSARGTAVVMLAVAIPVLAASMGRAHAGSAAALVTWAGALLYVVYNSILFLFLTPFNSAFPLYVGMLGLSVWSVELLRTSVGIRALAGRFSPHAPVRGVAVYVWIVVALNAAAWLGRIVPALSDTYPENLMLGTGVATNAIYVQDLALWLPLMAVSAYWLYRREARGLVICSAVLAMWVIESISISVDQWMGHVADPTATVVSPDLVDPFVLLAIIGLVPVWLMLRNMLTADEALPAPELPATHAGRTG